MPIRAKPRELHWFFVIMSAEIRQKHFPFSAPFALQYICTKLTENFINKTIFIYTFFFCLQACLSAQEWSPHQIPKMKTQFTIGVDATIKSHPIFRFLFLVTFGNEVTKIRKYYVIFVYILQGKMEKNQKENHATKVTKISKTKRRKYGMNKTLKYAFYK